MRRLWLLSLVLLLAAAGPRTEPTAAAIASAAAEETRLATLRVAAAGRLRAIDAEAAERAAEVAALAEQRDLSPELNEMAAGPMFTATRG